MLSVIVGVERMCVGFLTSQLLYKYGRRVLCLTSLFFMAVLMLISGSSVLLVHKHGKLSGIRLITEQL